VWIERLDKDRSVCQPRESCSAFRDVGNNVVGKVSVDIKERKPCAPVDILANEVLEEVRLSRTGEADDPKMHGSLSLSE
jgi:hypothetical protein